MRRAGLRGPLAVWALFGAVAAATVATYARVPAGELWNVSGSGLAGGLSRALVYLDYPVGFAAIAIVLVVEERVRRPALAAVAIALCAVAAVPGVVRESDLDARWINVVPALGVALALVLTAVAVRRGGPDAPAARGRLDAARLVLGAALLVVAVPWIAAALGFHANGPYLSSRILPEAGHPHLAAVHLGLHHGLDGACLVLAALVLSRSVRPLEPGARRTALAVYLSFLLVYGLANVVNDAWEEQVVKRGWGATPMPGVTTPSFNAAWAGVLLVGAALATTVLYRLARERADAAPAPRVPA